MKHKFTLSNKKTLTVSDVEIDGNFSQYDTDSWVDAYVDAAWNEDANRFCTEQEINQLNDIEAAQEILFHRY